MNSGELLIVLALALPLFGAALTYAVGRSPDVRDTLTVVMAVALAIVGFSFAAQVAGGARPTLSLGEPLAGVSILFRVEPLGALFAAMSSGLAAINSVFAIGYMRAKSEKNQTRFYMCISLAMFGAMGVAMAGNLFTAFIFYEVITLSTYPLVAHKRDAAARRAGRIYLGTLVGASVALLVPGIVTVQALAGTTDFIAGGVLDGKVSGAVASLILILIVFGVAKAALFPMHGWLPEAMVAPTPVSALLHAVVVVKAGVFLLLKVSAYTFGPDLMMATRAAEWLTWLAAGTMVAASLVALTKDEIKARLAWSTIGQLAYVTAAALMSAGGGLAAGGVHMLAHALAKITLFMCAGAIYASSGVTLVSQMNGMGRVSPAIFAAFLLASLSVIGLPPFGGMWSKMMLMQASVGTGYPWIMWAMIASSILTAIYLLPIAVNGLLPPTDRPSFAGTVKRGASYRMMVTALCITAAGAMGLFLFADAIASFLAPVGYW
jgi:multicomponent Na+:H+ antiporter subunit D